MSYIAPFRHSFLIGTLISVTLTGVLIFLDSQNLLSLEFQFIGAKALIAAQGPDPRLSAMGFVFPPLLIYLTLLIGSPLSTQILLGTGLIALMIWLVNQLPCGWLWRGIILILLLINPAFLIMLMTSPTWTAIGLFLGLSVLLYWHLINPRDRQYPLSVNLVLLGLTLATLVLLRYEFWFLLPVFMILSYSCIQGRDIELKFTMVIVTSFMSLVSIAGFLYVNWLISRNPFYFIYASGNGLRWPGMEFLLEPAPGLQAIWSSFIWIGQTLPVYYLLSIFVLYQIRKFLVPRFLLMAVPILVLIFMFWQNNFLPQAAIFGSLSILIPITLLQFNQIKSKLSFVIALGIFLGITLTGNLLNLNKFVPEESLVWRQITGQKFPQNGVVFRWRQRQLDQQEMTNILFRRLQPGQKVLLDNAVNFSFIYLLHNPHVFILPHQYEFSVALSQPEEIVDYVLVRREVGIQPPVDKILDADSNQDLVDPALIHRPNRGTLPQQLGDNSIFNDFEVVASNTFYQLFQRL